MCYKEYRETPKAVLFTTEYKTDILLELKKRNYLNVVLVDANYRQRFSNFLKEKQVEESLEAVHEFMRIDERFHNEEFEKCLELVRVRLLNTGK